MFISECTAHCIAISCTSLKGTSNFNIYPVRLQQFTFEPLYTGYIYIYIRFTFEFLIYIALLQVTMQHVSFVAITDGESQEMFKVASIYFLP